MLTEGEQPDLSKPQEPPLQYLANQPQEGLLSKCKYQIA